MTILAISTVTSPGSALPAGSRLYRHVVPLSKLAETIELASGEQGLKETMVGLETKMVAMVANGLNPFRLVKSATEGAVLDELRNGPLDKHGAGSRILGVDAQVHLDEIDRLAEALAQSPVSRIAVSR